MTNGKGIRRDRERSVETKPIKGNGDEDKRMNRLLMVQFYNFI